MCRRNHKKRGEICAIAAEWLIEHLPINHPGRNEWLANYGVSTEADFVRAGKSLNRSRQDNRKEQ